MSNNQTPIMDVSGVSSETENILVTDYTKYDHESQFEAIFNSEDASRLCKFNKIDLFYVIVDPYQNV